ncbi:phage major capsid protein, partial [Klebsiella pneumoniae]
PLSQESIDDSSADLISIVAKDISERKNLFLNQKILEVMKTFTPKTISDLDGLKAIKNVDLDKAYNPIMVVSASFYQWLDTLKDKNNRYILNDTV